MAKSKRKSSRKLTLVTLIFNFVYIITIGYAANKLAQYIFISGIKDGIPNFSGVLWTDFLILLIPGMLLAQVLTRLTYKLLVKSYLKGTALSNKGYFKLTTIGIPLILVIFSNLAFFLIFLGSGVRPLSEKNPLEYADVLLVTLEYSVYLILLLVISNLIVFGFENLTIKPKKR